MIACQPFDYCVVLLIGLRSESCHKLPLEQHTLEVQLPLTLPGSLLSWVNWVSRGGTAMGEPERGGNTHGPAWPGPPL